MLILASNEFDDIFIMICLNFIFYDSDLVVSPTTKSGRIMNESVSGQNINAAQRIL